jgi:predicted DNA-binding transcriptional regulator AlpA
VGDLVSRVEIADMLGVSRQRLHQLLGRDDFPQPIATLGIGKVWERQAVEQWAREAGRARMDEDDA